MKKEEKNLEQEKEMKEKISFVEVGKEVLIEPEKEEMDLKEEISQYPDEVVSPEVKKELIEVWKKVDSKIVKLTDGGLSIHAKKGERQQMEASLQKGVNQNRQQKDKNADVITKEENDKVR